MKRIVLTQGKVALVDDEDYEKLNQSKWYAQNERGIFYALRHNPGDNAIIRMHREILSLTKGDGKITDHINGDGLDNRKENLRLVTPAQNIMNSKIRKDSTTGYKGVHLVNGRYQASIRLGTFDTPEEAARTYDKAAEIFFGRYARLNFTKENLNG